MDIDCASIEAAASAGSTFASNYYKTNATGTGSEKTIKSASDWSASDMIAQGVANDDSNVFKGPHEDPVYDAITGIHYPLGQSSRFPASP